MPPRRPRAFDAATLWDHVSFRWVWPLLEVGREAQRANTEGAINLALVETLKSTNDDAQALASRLNGNIWHDDGRPSLVRGIAKTFWTDMAMQQVWTGLESAQRVAMAVLLRSLLTALADEDATRGYIFAGALSAVAFAYCLCHHQTFWYGMRLGYRMRVAGVGVLHKKALTLAPHGFSFGGLTTLVSNDVQRFEELGVYWQFLAWGPIEALVVLVLLAFELGVVPAVVGIGVLLLLAPTQSMLSRNIGKHRQRTAALTDMRVKETSEVCTGILPVKMHCFETAFKDRLGRLRAAEESSLRTVTTLRASNAALFFAAPLVSSFALFATYVQLGMHEGVLTQARVFYAIALLQLPRLWMVNFFLRASEISSEARASVARVNAFLALPQWHAPREPPSDGDVAARLNGCSFRWTAPQELSPSPKSSPAPDQSNARDVLTSIKLDIRKGELLAVIGRVGAGKSSLLAALLGELPPVPGSDIALTPEAPPVAAVCHQEPWLQSGTVRENVLFGEPDGDFDAERYAIAIKSSALEHDLRWIPGGDACLLGERGVNLSGGQKARLGLARCVYSRAPLKLLDDPLSALDAVVAKEVFDQCIAGPAMQGCTRVLCTHHKHVLKRCDRVAMLRDGELVALGTYDEVLAQVQELDAKQSLNLSAVMLQETSNSGRPSLDVDSVMTQVADAPAPITVEAVTDQLGAVPDHSAKNEPSQEMRDGGLVKETAASGHVKRAIYASMLRRFGILSAIVILVAMALGQLLQLGVEVFLGEWARRSAAEQTKDRQMFYVTFSALVGCAAIVALWRSFFYMHSLVSVDTQLHSDMLASLLRAPLSFFHVNPVGRILNRFTKDLATADELFPNVSFDTLQCIAMCLSAFVVIAIANPLSIPFVLVLNAVFLRLRSTFLASSREVKRGEAISRSPVYADFSAALRGLGTIRCFGVQKHVHAEFLATLDRNASWHVAFIGCQRWLGFRLDAICGVVVLVASVLSVAAVTNTWGAHVSNKDLIALSLSQALTLSGLLQWATRQSAETENHMTALERIVEYANHLPTEYITADPDGSRTVDVWPTKGGLEFVGVHARYRQELSPCLRGVDMTIPGGSSVGIVGRTGSGKSSLLLSLFHLIEVFDGTIRLDGFTASEVGLTAWRRQLSVIPQEPVIFATSIRQNLDPLLEHTDAELWEALKAAHVDEAVRRTGGLDGAFADETNGKNAEGESSSGKAPADAVVIPTSVAGKYSAGQRQLLALARILVSRAKIIALDEPTSNVDRMTDVSVQQALRDEAEAHERTVLVVAHRLQTIEASSLIAVMSDGRVQEADAPHALIAKGGAYAALVAASKMSRGGV